MEFQQKFSADVIDLHPPSILNIQQSRYSENTKIALVRPIPKKRTEEK